MLGLGLASMVVMDSGGLRRCADQASTITTTIIMVDGVLLERSLALRRS